jgi:hypothetical protein
MITLKPHHLLRIYYPVLFQEHGIKFDAMYDVVKLSLASTIHGLRDGTMEDVDGTLASANLILKHN